MTDRERNQVTMTAMEVALQRFAAMSSMDVHGHDMEVSVWVSGTLQATGEYRRARLEGIALAARLWDRNYDLTHRLREGV